MANGLTDSHNTDAFCLGNLSLSYLQKVVSIDSFGLDVRQLHFLGAADQVSVFIRSTLIQLNTPDDKRGRVSSISGLAISASNELGEMRAGLAAALLGPVWAVALGGAGAIVVTAIWTVVFPELRRAKTFAPQYRQKEQVP